MKYYLHYFSSCLKLTLFIVFVIAFSPCAFGASVMGTVKDENDTVIPYIAIRLILLRDCKCSDCTPPPPDPCPKCCAPQWETQTNEDGSFEFPEVPSGVYRITIGGYRFKLFCPSELTGLLCPSELIVASGQPLSVEVVLRWTAK